jgi:hypothetical protein
MHKENIHGHIYALPDYNDKSDIDVIFKDFADTLNVMQIFLNPTAMTDQNINSLLVFDNGATFNLPPSPVNIPNGSEATFINKGASPLVVNGVSIAQWKSAKFIKLEDHWAKVI